MSIPNTLPDHMDFMLRNSIFLDPLRDKYGLEVGEFGKPEVIPGKQYGARVIIPVSYQGESAKLITLAFRPGDGTGDTSTYTPGVLEIPEAFQFEENPSRVYPRAKNQADGTPVPIEAIFPIFVTQVGKKWAIAHNSTLLELSVVGQNALGIIGRIQTYGRPKLLHTVSGVGRNRFGDPHAIVSPRDSGFEGGYQVAGFLSTNDTKSKVFKLLKQEGERPPNY